MATANPPSHRSESVSPQCSKGQTPSKSRPTDTRPIPITDLHDPRLRPYTALKDRQLAAEAGLFICEGEHNVRRLFASRYETASLLIAEHRIDAFAKDIPADTVVYTAPNELLSSVVGFDFHLGVLSCGRRPEDVLASSLMPTPTLVVLPEIRNAENLGLIARAAHALGAGGLLLSDKGCDPFARRVIRVSMGSVLGLPIVRSPRLAEDLRLLRDMHGMALLALVCDNDAQPLTSYRRPATTQGGTSGGNSGAGVALVLGNEPDGLAESWVDLCGERVTIPMAAGVDSLNVAVAAGIVLHHLSSTS